jgi:hypothetical protein
MRVTSVGRALCLASGMDAGLGRDPEAARETERGPDTRRDPPRFGAIELDFGAPHSATPTVVLRRERLDELVRESAPYDSSEPTVSMPAKALPLRRVVPRILKSPRELAHLPLDSRRVFLLSFVDGQHSIGEIVDACGMLDALHHLVELAADDVIGLD